MDIDAPELRKVLDSLLDWLSTQEKSRSRDISSALISLGALIAFQAAPTMEEAKSFIQASVVAGLDTKRRSDEDFQE